MSPYHSGLSLSIIYCWKPSQTHPHGLIVVSHLGTPPAHYFQIHFFFSFERGPMRVSSNFLMGCGFVQWTEDSKSFQMPHLKLCSRIWLFHSEGDAEDTDQICSGSPEQFYRHQLWHALQRCCGGC